MYLDEVDRCAVLVGVVQVMLFSDRLEIWNPGELPPPLTLESLRLPHASFPHNPLVADPMFLARYIEEVGSGILDMIGLCRDADLPTPEFRQDGGMFVQTLRKDVLTPQKMTDLGLNDRQRAGIARVLEHGRLASADFQKLSGASRQTTTRDLDELVSKGLLFRRGRGVIFLLAQNRLKNASNPMSHFAARVPFGFSFIGVFLGNLKTIATTRWRDT